MTDPELIVMAAGVGSRYGGIKQIEPIGPNGEIILDYSIYDALRAGFQKVIFVINKEIEQDFRERIERTIAPHCGINYVYQELDDLPANIDRPARRTKPWGTAHAVLSCRNMVENPFAVINADDFYGRTAYQTLFSFLCNVSCQEDDYRFCMVGYILEKTLTEHGYVARGVCDVDRNGYLIAIQERTRIERFGQIVKYTQDGSKWITIPENSIVSMNMWGFTPIILKELENHFYQFLIKNNTDLMQEEYFLPDVVNELLREKKATVKVLSTKEGWYGVTYKPDKSRIEKAVMKLIQQGEYPESLWEQ